MNWLKVMLIVLPILSVIWISFFSYGTIPTLIALILGIIIPAVFWGIAYSSALVISWWLMLIALFFAILFSAGIVLLSHADLSMTKVEGGVAKVVSTGAGIILCGVCFMSWLAVFMFLAVFFFNT